MFRFPKDLISCWKLLYMTMDDSSCPQDSQRMEEVEKKVVSYLVIVSVLHMNDMTLIS